jgi:hypothetical protein
MVMGYPSYSGVIQLIYDGLPLSTTRFIKNKIRNIQQTIDLYNLAAIWGNRNQPSVTNTPCPI